MTQTTPRRREGGLTRLLVPIAYAILVVLMTWPAALHLSRRLIGNNIDNWIFYWNNWWLERALADGGNWFFTPYLFYPQGSSLIAHSNSHASSLLAIALKPLAGPVGAYNLTLLLGLWLSAVGMFLLVYNLTRHRVGAFVAGFVFAFAPYHVTQALTHVHLGSIQWWPFYALFLHRALRERRIRDALGTGLCAALTLWTGLHLALLLALWTLAYVGWWLFAERTGKEARLRALGLLGLIATSALLLSLPVVVPIIDNWAEITHAPTPLVEQTTRQTDLLAYVVPPTHNTLVGSRVVSIYERFIANRSTMPYLGFAALALALIALFKQPRQALFWGLSGGLWILLAAGAALRVNGTVYPNVPLPYSLVGDVFPMSVLRSPDRFNLLVILSLPPLAGLGATWLFDHRRRWLVPLALLLLLEYLCIPLPAWDLPPASSFFDQMAQDEEVYGVVDYPMSYQHSKLWLYYQTLHGKPTVEGHVSRYTAATYAFIHSQPLLQAFYQVAEPLPYPLPGDGTDDLPEAQAPVEALGPALRGLETAGVRYVLLHKPYLDAELQAHFQRVLPIAPVYEDSALAVYDVAQPMPLLYDGLPVPLGPGVALARFGVQTTTGDPKWQIQMLAILLDPGGAPLACQVQLAGNGETVLASPVTWFEEPPDGGIAWAAGDLAVKEFVTPLPDDLEPGAYQWSISCPEGETYTAPDTLQVYADGHITYLRRQVNVRYGDTIRLQGYRWRTVGTNLRIGLRWEALEEPEADYKVFVHLLDADGEMVRQHDSVPCGWQCPTSQWQAGDAIPDRATISLWELPAGEYSLAVGLYDSQTLERLPAQGPEGELYPDGYYILPDAFSLSSSQPESTVEAP